MKNTTNQDICTAVRKDSSNQLTPLQHKVHQQNRETSVRLRTHGIHSIAAMNSAGFEYTGDGDTARCSTCNLEISGWTRKMLPFFVHAERSPECPLVCSRFKSSRRESSDHDYPVKHQKTESNSNQYQQKYRLIEMNTMKQVRRRTFSHWSSRNKPSVEQMIAAGFFACNVGDRVICIYCDLICQKWLPTDDDPSEVHKTLSPKCLFVQSMLLNLEPTSTLILNEVSTNTNQNRTPRSSNTTHLRLDPVVYTTPCHPSYSNITKRLESFRTWSHESTPATDDLIRAGFFYTGASTIVTCFYCNGSLQNWAATDNPVIEHVRWFPHCPYAKQLCGDDLYQKIQKAKRARQEHRSANQTNANDNTTVSNHPQLQMNDANTLSRYVAARLDLPISQNLLNQNFKLSVIKRCWEDQLQLKHDDFVSDSDLLMSCNILQKQIDHIQGQKENIIIPSEQMKLIREGVQTHVSSLSTSSNDSENETKENQSTSTESSTSKEANSNKVEPSSTDSSSVSNPCIICYQEEKRLACIPCGHFSSCVPCSHSLRTCPVCRREIEAFVRIFI